MLWKIYLSRFALLFLVIGTLYVLPAGAQGLVGAPVETHIPGRGDLLADYGYDQARDVSRVVTASTAALALGLGIYRSRKVKGKRLAKEICALLAAPVIVHLAGTFAINNCGGLGGCVVAFFSGWR